jgi:hypothetical protein
MDIKLKNQTDLTSRKSWTGAELNLELRMLELKNNPKSTIVDVLKEITQWEKDTQIAKNNSRDTCGLIPSLSGHHCIDRRKRKNELGHNGKI